MRTFMVSFVLVLEDGHSNPSKWIPQAISENLYDFDYVYDWSFEEITENPDNNKTE